MGLEKCVCVGSTHIYLNGRVIKRKEKKKRRNAIRAKFKGFAAGQ